MSQTQGDGGNHMKNISFADHVVLPVEFLFLPPQVCTKPWMCSHLVVILRVTRRTRAY